MAARVIRVDDLGSTVVASPCVVTGALSSWPAAAWTADSLSEEFGECTVRARFHLRALAADDTEAEGLSMDVKLGAFCQWLKNEGTLARQFPPALYTGYVSYQRFPDVFRTCPAGMAAVDWSVLGIDSEDGCGGMESNLWIGGAGARTPLHQDAYGANVVAQLYGSKRWTLRPPDEVAPERITRVPFEESSSFAFPDAGQLQGRSMVVDLSPGEVLLVPKHWWHAVETREGVSISVNRWLALPDDALDRTREALVRVIACGLMRYSGTANSLWLNDGEDVLSGAQDLELLNRTLRGRLGTEEGAETSPALSMADVADALCSPHALDAALLHLRRRAALKAKAQTVHMASCNGLVRRKS